MSPQLVNALQEGSTSAGGAMHSSPGPYPLVVPSSLPTFGTAARSLSCEDWEGLFLVPFQPTVRSGRAEIEIKSGWIPAPPSRSSGALPA